MACGILVPRPRIEPGPLSVRVQSPNHWTTSEFPKNSVLINGEEERERTGVLQEGATNVRSQRPSATGARQGEGVEEEVSIGRV